MPLELYKNQGVSYDLRGSVLVLPAVAFANVGELAIDVLVCTLKAQLAARLDDENLLACVGNNAYSTQPPGLLATALELYQVPGAPLFVLQQRAPAIPGRQSNFAADMAAWAKQAGFSHVLLLCGLDAQYRREQQLEGTQLRYLDSTTSSSGSAATGSSGGAAAAQASSTEATAEAGTEGSAAGSFGSSCAAVGLKVLEQEVIDTEREVHGLLPPWPLLDALQQQGLAHTLLATFAAEGDNVQDAMGLAGKLLGALQLKGLVQLDGAGSGSSAGGDDGVRVQLQVPCSWVGLYGRTFDRSLF